MPDVSKITHCYGIPTGTGLLAGAGYGKNPVVSQAADRCAQWLVEHLDRPVEVRCNSDGRSGGAFHDDPDGTTHYGLNVHLGENGLSYGALFRFPLTRLTQVAKIPHSDIYEGSLFTILTDYGTVYSPRYGSLEAAGQWLLRWGPRFCEAMQT